MKNKYLWKSMRAGLKSEYGTIDWKAGNWYVHEGEPETCNEGFHASENVIDAMGYVNCEVLCKVEVRGKSDIEPDKQAWSEMKIVKAYHWVSSHNRGESPTEFYYRILDL